MKRAAYVTLWLLMWVVCAAEGLLYLINAALAWAMGKLR